MICTVDDLTCMQDERCVVEYSETCSVEGAFVSEVPCFFLFDVINFAVFIAEIDIIFMHVNVIYLRIWVLLVRKHLPADLYKVFVAICLTRLHVVRKNFEVFVENIRSWPVVWDPNYFQF